MQQKHPCVYILASKPYGTLYIGVTSNLQKRIWEHKNNLIEGFTSKYGIHDLVWYELHEAMESAIVREKRLKNWWEGAVSLCCTSGMIHVLDAGSRKPFKLRTRPAESNTGCMGRMRGLR